MRHREVSDLPQVTQLEEQKEDLSLSILILEPNVHTVPVHLLYRALPLGFRVRPLLKDMQRPKVPVHGSEDAWPGVTGGLEPQSSANCPRQSKWLLLWIQGIMPCYY